MEENGWARMVQELFVCFVEGGEPDTSLFVVFCFLFACVSLRVERGIGVRG